jgi:hypothetical protein
MIYSGSVLAVMPRSESTPAFMQRTRLADFFFLGSVPPLLCNRRALRMRGGDLHTPHGLTDVGLPYSLS